MSKLAAVLRGRETESYMDSIIRDRMRTDDVDCYWRSQPFSGWDHKGYDFLVVFSDIPDLAFPLQVKSSEKGKEKFCAQSSKDIPCIVCGPHIDYETVQMRFGLFARLCRFEAQTKQGVIRALTLSQTN